MGSEARPVTLRRARVEDAAAVGHIHVESWHVAYRGIMPDDVIARTDLAYRTKLWAERIADAMWPVFLIEAQGEPVAFCQMVPSKDPTTIPHASDTSHRCTCCRVCAGMAMAAG
jgi:hypothetical protein